MQREERIKCAQLHYELWVFISWYILTNWRRLCDTREYVRNIKNAWPKRNLFMEGMTCFPCYVNDVMRYISEVMYRHTDNHPCAFCPIFSRNQLGDNLCGRLYDCVQDSLDEYDPKNASVYAYRLAIRAFNWNRSGLPGIDENEIPRNFVKFKGKFYKKVPEGTVIKPGCELPYKEASSSKKCGEFVRSIISRGLESGFRWKEIESDKDFE